MPSTKYSSIEQYIQMNSSDDFAKDRMKELHDFILQHMKKYDIKPDIGYNMPMYKYKGRPAVYFGWAKNHISFNIPPYGLYQKFAKELEGYTTTVSALHLLHKNPIDYKLVGKILDYRIKEMEQYEADKFEY